MDPDPGLMAGQIAQLAGLGRRCPPENATDRAGVATLVRRTKRWVAHRPRSAPPSAPAASLTGGAPALPYLLPLPSALQPLTHRKR